MVGQSASFINIGAEIIGDEGKLVCHRKVHIAGDITEELYEFCGDEVGLHDFRGESAEEFGCHVSACVVFATHNLWKSAKFFVGDALCDAFWAE